MSTIHNPTNFDPTQYEVIDYLDNRIPQYLPGTPIEIYQEEVAEWRASMRRLFGEQFGGKICKCIHCGNGNVRWVTAVRHIPTNENFVFGADCTARLDFPNKVAFKLARLKSLAEARDVRFKIYTKREAYLEANPAIAQALKEIDEPQHARNHFAKDVLAKLDQYGELSERQRDTVLKSLREDNERAEREAAEPKGDAPSGRVEVKGEVLSLKEVFSDFGMTLKMVLKLENGARCYISAPARYDIKRGDHVHIRGTFEVSKDDKSFAWGSRPHMIKHTPKQVAQPVPAAQLEIDEDGRAKMLVDALKSHLTVDRMIETLQTGEKECEGKGNYVDANIFRIAIKQVQAAWGAV